MASQFRNYRKEGENAMSILMELYQVHKDWRVEQQQPNFLYDISSTTSFPKTHMKVFKVKAIIAFDAKTVWEAVTQNLEESTKWNLTVKEIKIIKTVDENTLVIRHITPEAAHGIVKCRDFINVMYREVQDDTCMYRYATASTEHPDWPEQRGFVRGETGPSGMIIQPLEGDPTKCTMHWFISSDMKGMLPKVAIEIGLPTVIHDYLRYLRLRLQNQKLQSQSDSPFKK